MKTKVYGIRLTDREKSELERAASELGMTLAAYIKFMRHVKVEPKGRVRKEFGK